MASTKHPHQQSIFRPGAELNVYTATATKILLGQALAQPGELVIDLAQVEEIDSAGLQLLLLAHRECQRNQRGLRLSNARPAVLDVLALCELNALCPRVHSPEEAQNL